MAQILCGNLLLSYAVVFLECVGFDVIQAFNTNMELSACFIIGGVICWLLFPHLGRATIYISGLCFMFITLAVIDGLAFFDKQSAQGIVQSSQQ